MSIFEIIKEPTGGVSIIENNQDSFFGPNFSPRFKVRGITVIVIIADSEYHINATDTVMIDSGEGAYQFAGGVQDLKAALIPVFPKANTSSGGSGGTVAVKEFTDQQKQILLQIIEAHTTS